MGFPDSNEHTITVASVGTKGQIVIPLEIRERLNIQPGDKVVLLMRSDHGAFMMPMSGMRDWLDKLTANVDELSALVDDDNPTQTKKGTS